MGRHIVSLLISSVTICRTPVILKSDQRIGGYPRFLNPVPNQGFQGIRIMSQLPEIVDTRYLNQGVQVVRISASGVPHSKVLNQVPD